MYAYGNLSATNLFGLNNMVNKVDHRQQAGTEQIAGEKDPVFLASLMEAVEAAQSEGQGSESGDSSLLQSMDNGTLSSLYRNYIFGDTQTDNVVTTERLAGEEGGYTEPIDETEPTYSTNPTEPVDPGNNDPGTSPVVANASIEQVVLAAGSENVDLIQKMNNANTMDERLGYAEQLRDKIVESLNEAGYSASATNKADKITVDGTTYDVIKASKGIGKRAGVQLIEVTEGTSGTTESDAMAESIFRAAESSMDLIRQISASGDVSERRDLAFQVQENMVANLRDSGFTASTGASPDKITVNGQTYDFLRSLNAPGQTVYLQSILV